MLPSARTEQTRLRKARDLPKLEPDVHHLRYWWQRLRNVHPVDFLHRLTEPGVEPRIGRCEPSNSRFVRRFHVDHSECAVRRLLMPGGMTGDTGVPHCRLVLGEPWPRYLFKRLAIKFLLARYDWHRERESRHAPSSASEVMITN